LPSDREAWPDALILGWEFDRDPNPLPRAREIRVRLLLKYAKRTLGMKFTGFADHAGDALTLPPEAWMLSLMNDDDSPVYLPTVKHKPKALPAPAKETIDMRVCPFPDCGKTIKSEFFACYRHFKAMTKDQQAEVYRIYDAWQRGDLSADELRAAQAAIVDAATARGP
jgi:hypothetical protein